MPRKHAHGVRVKGGAYRKLYISDELDRLYGEYLFWLVRRLRRELVGRVPERFTTPSR